MSRSLLSDTHVVFEGQSNQASISYSPSKPVNYAWFESQWFTFPPDPEPNVKTTFARSPSSQIDTLIMELHIGKIGQATSSGLPSPYMDPNFSMSQNGQTNVPRRRTMESSEGASKPLACPQRKAPNRRIRVRSGVSPEPKPTTTLPCDAKMEQYLYEYLCIPISHLPVHLESWLDSVKPTLPKKIMPTIWSSPYNMLTYWRLMEELCSAQAFLTIDAPTNSQTAQILGSGDHWLLDNSTADRKRTTNHSNSLGLSSNGPGLQETKFVGPAQAITAEIKHNFPI
ncbi:hypothetical protein CVT25_002436 [Psilocybe cyanescens]|uniref:Uncharacterized protein n=1 Tax=Psilocybe cyanescens TaxID=93625 RepID=A0A409WK26_PSICY|nr:hypothetical protein CVT25_002436 [Psilocybe cyanescens]